METDINKTIVECIVNATKRDDLKDIAAHDPFNSHDIDSLDQMSIMLEIEEKFQIELEGVDIKSIRCVNDYADLVNERN
ncbi:acyl carrier protein [Rubripirellula lacrimiformis]|uniref:Acyl carrier protein n=1 Tax=Rubripirellula lacrimiformis TaxID=1930273 RepID=A0A517N8S6_9BACT|nr:acyl carrier protein [Rubripirellula lacrimiformis]QDT03531.1 acyl carrier protein [Rubripirellula lacrimiformis]